VAWHAWQPYDSKITLPFSAVAPGTSEYPLTTSLSGCASLAIPGRVDGLSLRSTRNEAIATVSSRMVLFQLSYSAVPSGMGRLDAGSSGFGQRFGIRVLARNPRG